MSHAVAFAGDPRTHPLAAEKVRFDGAQVRALLSALGEDEKASAAYYATGANRAVAVLTNQALLVLYDHWVVPADRISLPLRQIPGCGVMADAFQVAGPNERPLVLWGSGVDPDKTALLAACELTQERSDEPAPDVAAGPPKDCQVGSTRTQPVPSRSRIAGQQDGGAGSARERSVNQRSPTARQSGLIYAPPRHSQPAASPRQPSRLAIELSLLLTIAMVALIAWGGIAFYKALQPNPGPMPNVIGMTAGDAKDEIVDFYEKRNLQGAYGFEVTDASSADRNGVEDEEDWIVVDSSPDPGETVNSNTEVILETLRRRELRFYTEHKRMPRIAKGILPARPLRAGVMRDLRAPGGWPLSLVDYRLIGTPKNLGWVPDREYRTTGVTFPRAGKRLRLGQPILVQVRAVPAPPAPPVADKHGETSNAPSGGWTNDALTPGYTGCRQGYPGGRINGVYWWRPIPC